MLSHGIVLQERYRIKRLLARGGMGAVYEAEAIHLRNAPVAVKETFFDEDHKKLREQFEREAATLARLHHPALPRVKDHFIEGGGQFLVMDFIAGDDLGNLLDQRLKEKGEPFEFWQVMEWAERLLDALDYIHGQYPPVIHRDIKPQNLKLTPRGELFLIDFGLAKDATTPTRPGQSVYGFTLEFAPPEQIKGAGTDARSDLYSLGATLYHLATGKLPPDARIREEAVVKHLMPDLLQPAHHVNPHLPFAFASALAKAMALDREQRYQNAQEMWQALCQIKGDIEAEIAERERQEAERRRLQEEERKRSEEEARQREVVQRLHEEGARLQFLRDEISRKEERLAKLKRAIPDEGVTEPIVSRPVTPGRRINQKKVARDAAPAVRRKTPRVSIGAIAVITLIALLAYLLRNIVNSKNDKATDANPSSVATAENSPPPPPAASYVVWPARIEMVYVPGGSFLMGSPENERRRDPSEGPQHHVSVQSFYIGKYEVTQAQWRAVMKSDPSLNRGDNLPVERVSWNDAKEFCRKLSQMTGDEYRLPTEAEWEYACRAKTVSAYAGNLDAMAWYLENSDSRSHPVGGKQPNAYRLHDMLGNVWEWCEDDWHDSYANAPNDGSAWVEKPRRGSTRIFRGGSWGENGVFCRSAGRASQAPGYRSGYDGFRLARTYR